MIAEGGGIAGDGQNIANATDGPGAEQHGLQADDIGVAGGYVRDGFETVRFERTGQNHGVHADASESAAIDVDGVDCGMSHDASDLIENSVDGYAFRRGEFHGSDKFSGLNSLPELAFRFASDRAAQAVSRIGDFHGFGGSESAAGAGRSRNLFYSLGHRVNVIRRSSAATAENARADFGRFLGEERKIFRRGSRVDRAVTNAFWESGVGHGGQRKGGMRGQMLQYRQEKLRTDGAICADGLNIFSFQFFPGVLRAGAAESGAFIGIG